MGAGVDLLCCVAIDIVLNTGLSCLLYRVFYGLFEGCVVEGATHYSGLRYGNYRP